MKLREKLGEKSIWTKIKIFYITLFFLSIITLVVNYADWRNWLLEFRILHLTSQFDSSVRYVIEKEMVITNITFSLARKFGNLESTQNSLDLQHLSQTTLDFQKVKKNRFIWNPGLVLGAVKNVSSRISLIKKTAEGENKRNKLDKSEINTGFIGLSNQGMPCQVSAVKAQRSKDAMSGFSGLSDQGTPCQVSAVKAQRSKNAMPSFSGLSDQGMPCQVSVGKAQRSKDAMPGFSGLSDRGTPCQVSVLKAQRSKDRFMIWSERSVSRRTTC